MALPLVRYYTVEDYYAMPEDIRVELIEGQLPFSVQFQNIADTVVEPDITVICEPDRITKRGCLGTPEWIIDADQNKIYVYDMRDNKLVLNQYTFQDKIKVDIYEDFYIDFSEFKL